MKPPAEFEAFVLEVVRATGKHFECSVLQIMGRRKTRQIARARATAMAILRKTGTSFPLLGQLLGVNHSTVLISVRRAKQEDIAAVEALITMPAPPPWILDIAPYTTKKQPHVLRCPNCSAVEVFKDDEQKGVLFCAKCDHDWKPRKVTNAKVDSGN